MFHDVPTQRKHKKTIQIKTQLEHFGTFWNDLVGFFVKLHKLRPPGSPRNPLYKKLLVLERVNWWTHPQPQSCTPKQKWKSNENYWKSTLPVRAVASGQSARLDRFVQYSLRAETAGLKPHIPWASGRLDLKNALMDAQPSQVLTRVSSKEELAINISRILPKTKLDIGSGGLELTWAGPHEGIYIPSYLEPACLVPKPIPARL